MTTNIILSNGVLFLSEILRILIMEKTEHFFEISMFNHFIFVKFKFLNFFKRLLSLQFYGIIN